MLLDSVYLNPLTTYPPTICFLWCSGLCNLEPAEVWGGR